MEELSSGIQHWIFSMLCRLGSRDNKLLGTSASLLVTSALLVVTRSYYCFRPRELVALFGNHAHVGTSRQELRPNHAAYDIAVTACEQGLQTLGLLFLRWPPTYWRWMASKATFVSCLLFLLPV